MRNPDIAGLLEEAAELMELHEENPFKIKSLQRAAQRIERMPIPLSGMNEQELEATEGIGKSIAQKIIDIKRTGSFQELEALRQMTPPGVSQMLSVKGLGPKKVKVLWKSLGIETPGELLYACEENRLIELKGFGTKSQDSIRQSVAYAIQHAGFFHYAKAERLVFSLLDTLRKQQPEIEFHLVGELRRKCEIISSARIIVSADQEELLKSSITQSGFPLLAKTQGEITIEAEGLQISFIPVQPAHLQYQIWRLTGNDSHIAEVRSRSGLSDDAIALIPNEQALYESANLPYLEPEWREGVFEFDLAQRGAIPAQMIETRHLRGALHNHTTYSDGRNTLEEMARACMELGLDYFGVCDHSRTAVYAGGLSIEAVSRQQEEIARLNKELAPFRIFSGIESDILSDGSLDYPDEILASFDFIVASVHSGLRMDKQKATERLLKAIENPFTSILGHPTGRLLLSREGYPIDIDVILDACKRHNVAIELNANPYRLDLDWRHLQAATQRGILISINPDAHNTDGLRDMHYGVLAARKGFLCPQHILNALSRAELESWFTRRKSQSIGYR